MRLSSRASAFFLVSSGRTDFDEEISLRKSCHMKSPPSMSSPTASTNSSCMTILGGCSLTMLIGIFGEEMMINEATAHLNKQVRIPSLLYV
eukprot:scaffold13631_cov38-Cyclotella_meneghiniana.AAC.4